MSDRELVQFDTQQFTTLEQRLGDIATRIGPASTELSLHQVLTHLETTLNKIATAMSGGDNSQLQTAINNLSRKVDEFMSTQEERLRGVKTKLDAIQTGVDKIQQQLADLKANNPELEDEIAAIEATASAIDTDVNPATLPDTGGDTGTGGAPA